MRRSLIHYWRINLAVAMAAAVATAVLTGALLVGDSVRGSLRDLTLDRLGQIDYAMTPGRFFRQDLAASLGQGAQLEKSVPAILLSANATHATTKARASKLNLMGIDWGFIDFFEPDSGKEWEQSLSKSSGQLFHPMAINEALQRELGAKIGDQLLLSFEQPSGIPRGSFLGRRDVSDLVKTTRFSLTRIIPDRGIGRFGLRSDQHLPLNVYVSLAVLQKALEQDEKVNALFVSLKTASQAELVAQSLRSALRKNLQLQDLGIALHQREKCISVESAEILLNPAIADAVQAVANKFKTVTQPILTYLANTMQVDDRIVPYSTVSALETPAREPFNLLKLNDGSRAPALAENEILLNEWAARDLGAQIGDHLKMSYYLVGAREQLMTQTADFRVAGVVALEGLGADPTLTPEFPGIHDAENMQAWDPPFPVDLNLIRPKDEAYWDQYRATPKAFVSLATGQRLWSTRFGNLTSIRLGVTKGSNSAKLSAKVQAGLLDRINPEQMGFVFQPVKAQGLAAAKGATDFGMLFFGFSLFLILSAALLVGMLFRLGVEQRASEIGTLLAVGYPLRAVRRRLLSEGGLLSAIGCFTGLGGAVAYAGILMRGLRTWWAEAIGSPFLFLHISATSLIIGYVAALVVTLLFIWWTVRRLGKVPALALLHGITTSEISARPRLSRIVAFAASTLAGVLIVVAIFSGAASSAGLFFGIGAFLLIAGLAFLSLWFRKLHHRHRLRFGFAAIIHMAACNGSRNPGHSMFSAALVGCACFVIVAVAANRRDPGKGALAKNSGAGGFALLAESDIPLHHDLNTEEGRMELGFSDADADIMEAARIFPLRMLPGDDASCLNLYQPQKPRLLGATQEQIERGGFQFQTIVSERPEVSENTWHLLEKEIAPGVIPAFGDYNSVLWILHLGLGKDLVLENELGEQIKLRFVGLLQSSIFQSEVLISEANLLKHFPSVSGYAHFLIETPFDRADHIGQTLEHALRDYGFDVTTTRGKLESYQAVENTYLSVFQTLGGLGLLLGTLGLGIVLIRNVIERRRELAVLQAFGFRSSTLATTLLAENGFLMLAGMLIGSVSALLAVIPHLTGGNAQIPWLSLGLTLLAVLFVGLVVSALSTLVALRTPLLPALKADG